MTCHTFHENISPSFKLLFKITYYIKEKKYTPKINQIPNLPICLLELPYSQNLLCEPIGLHIGFPTFPVEYVLMYLSPTKTNKIHNEVRIRKTTIFVSSFITHVHYLCLVLPHLLVFSLSHSACYNVLTCPKY